MARRRRCTPAHRGRLRIRRWVRPRQRLHSGAPENADHKGYLKRRAQITSEASDPVSFPKAPETFANGITNAGTVVGNYHTRRGDVTSAHAFIRQRGVYSTIDLHDLCAEKSEAWGANERDDDVGFYSDTAGVVHGFLAERHGRVSPIDVPGAAATRLYSITNQGVLLAHMTTPGGVSHGYIAAPRR